MVSLGTFSERLSFQPPNLARHGTAGCESIHKFQRRSLQHNSLDVTHYRTPESIQSPDLWDLDSTGERAAPAKVVPGDVLDSSVVTPKCDDAFNNYDLGTDANWQDTKLVTDPQESVFNAWSHDVMLAEFDPPPPLYDLKEQAQPTALDVAPEKDLEALLGISVSQLEGTLFPYMPVHEELSRHEGKAQSQDQYGRRTILPTPPRSSQGYFPQRPNMPHPPVPRINSSPNFSGPNSGEPMDYRLAAGRKAMKPHLLATPSYYPPTYREEASRGQPLKPAQTGSSSTVAMQHPARVVGVGDESARQKTCVSRYIAKDPSVSKMPLLELYACMNLAHNPEEAKRREARVMDLLQAEGFAVGRQTWIRDTPENERRRILQKIYNATHEEFAYSQQTLETIIRRGTYSRMQTRLRKRRRDHDQQLPVSKPQ